MAKSKRLVFSKWTCIMTIFLFIWYNLIILFKPPLQRLKLNVSQNTKIDVVLKNSHILNDTLKNPVKNDLNDNFNNFWSNNSNVNFNDTLKNPVKNNLKNILKFAIVNAADDKYIMKYQTHFDSMDCYAKIHGYDFVTVSKKTNFFSRHLAVRDVLPNYDWVLFLDGDTQIVNFAHTLQDFVRNASADIIFPQRFINGEIPAGAYLIRNSSWSWRFLTEWALRTSLPNSRVKNSDNGFLEQLLTKVLFVDEAESAEQQRAGMKCVEIFNKDLRRGKCCKSELMGSRREFTHVSILRRGQGFFRDDFAGRLLFVEDFGVHNKNRWKDSDDVYYAKTPTIPKTYLNDIYKYENGSCKRFKGFQPALSKYVPPAALKKYVLCVYDHIFATWAPMLGIFSPDVWDCFPNCAASVEVDKVIQCAKPGTKQRNYDINQSKRCERMKSEFTDGDWKLYYKTVVKDIDKLMIYISKNWANY